jgi:hypothetical protein
MNVTQVDARGSSGHRFALLAAVVLVIAAAALLFTVASGAARLELVLAALGCVSGAAVVTLLTR